MTVTCIGCKNQEFRVNPNDVEQLKVISFVCPLCGKTTAVEYSDSIGFRIGLVKPKKPSEQPKKPSE